MTGEPDKPVNLLWQVDEIIIALQKLRERLRRMARQDGPPPRKPRQAQPMRDGGCILGCTLFV